MPSPCNQSEERVVFDPDTKTVNLGVAFCPFLNKPCKPKGCPFANDPKGAEASRSSGRGRAALGEGGRA